MSNSRNLATLKNTIFKKITRYSQTVATLGHRVRRKVFGFRKKSTVHIDRWALPVKVLYDHRLVQRRDAFKKSGGNRSSIAMHALEKARHKQHP